MRWLYLAIGLLLFTGFCVTGRYMRLDFPDKDSIPPELRILMRSRHIYILFNSLIWLTLAAYYRPASTIAGSAIQSVGSVVLLLSAGCLVYGWYLESYLTGHFSDVSRWGIYLSLAGVGLHLLSSAFERHPRKPAE